MADSRGMAGVETKGFSCSEPAQNAAVWGGHRGFLRIFRPVLESRVPRSRQPSSEMDLITGPERSTSTIECQLRMKQDDCDYRGKLPGRMHVRRRGEYKAIVHLFCRT